MTQTLLLFPFCRRGNLDRDITCLKPVACKVKEADFKIRQYDSRSQVINQ